jgi:uncharacterized protein YyaL (SSP411 family)
MAAELGRHYGPSLVLAGGSPTEASGVALLEERPMRDGRATTYVCRQYLCEEPTTDPDDLSSQLDRAVRSPLGVGG